MKKLTLFLIAALCLAGVTTYAQSLGDIAREEQKRREAVSGDVFIIEKKSVAASPGRDTLTDEANEDAKFDIDIGDNPVLGSDSARFILVKFADYLCSFCGRYSRETFPHILKEYIDANILRYTVIDHPILHQHSEKAAQAAHCASDQGKFWEIHRLMMAQQDSLSDLSSYARALDLNLSEFENCLAREKYAKRIQNNSALARSLEITSVPYFIIGLVDPQNPRRVKGISSISGAEPFSHFQKEIEAAIADGK